MSSPEAFDAIKTAITSAGLTQPVVYENERFPLANSPAAFVFVEVFGTIYEQASIGAEPQASNKWREEGVLLMHVLVPNGTGTDAARTLAKQIANIFRGQEIAGVIFRDASIGAGEPGDQDGNYFRMTVRVDWQRDE
jgi:hypothetical protein